MGWSTGTYDQVWSISVESCLRYKTLKCWQKEIVQIQNTVADCDCVRTRHCCRHRRRTLPAGRQRPPWPQFGPLSCKCYRGSEANACIWVTWKHYVTRRRESILSENQDLTPNDPRLTFDPINADDVTKKSFWIFSHLCLRQIVQWVSFLSLEVVIWPFFDLWPVNVGPDKWHVTSAFFFFFFFFFQTFIED